MTAYPAYDRTSTTPSPHTHPYGSHQRPVSTALLLLTDIAPLLP